MKRATRLFLLSILLGVASIAHGQDMSDHVHHMTVEGQGVVMNENTDELPRDCQAISGESHITVHAGREYATHPGTVFGYDENELVAEPCSLATVTLVNSDQIRHQWMVHGLPKYLYPGGMFHIEAEGGQSVTGTFIVPSDDRTYLVHCDMPQHMEKGMKGQLQVGAGSGDLWSVPGVSGDFEADTYLPERIGYGVVAVFVLGVLLAFALRRWL